jgi:hypothetical protein
MGANSLGRHGSRITKYCIIDLPTVRVRVSIRETYREDTSDSPTWQVSIECDAIDRRSETDGVDKNPPVGTGGTVPADIVCLTTR